ncbi:MAG: hypothetical protein ABI446_06700 [Gemmatimonadaceae bacterium]
MTPPTKTAPKVADRIGVGHSDPISPFGTYTWTGAPNDVLKTKLLAAIDANKADLGPHPRVPFSIIALVKDGKHLYAGNEYDQEMHFSASLLKVAVMYVAYELRAAATRVVVLDDDIKTQQQFSDALTAAFKKAIDSTARPDLVGHPQPDWRHPTPTPNYLDTLSLLDRHDPKNPVEFCLEDRVTDRTEYGTPVHDNQPYWKALQRMIKISHDNSAAQCIAGLGYGYINAALKTAGFFVPHAEKKKVRGIWVAGDYENLGQFRIYAQNDGDGALVMCTEAMCRLVAMIESGDLVNDIAVGGTTNQQMKDLLAATHHNTPYISAFSPAPFTIVRNKLGFGFLGKTNVRSVSSECSVLSWTLDAAGETQKLLDKHNLTGSFVFCWQNVRTDLIPNFTPLGKIAAQTYQEFLNSTP